ncbi:MAG: hypothetical protein H6667_14220 [Ardenticatenaceae bacterium]|nr:hypothetical protein [Ardenticatenaceae bacterium]MCB9444212.1 hypothetical protein [Ardenticatenaceae bacterium]
MNSDYPPSLHHWLSQVTNGLPNDVTQTINAEISDHFLDAVDDYMANGLSKAEAQTRALAYLGAAETISRGLKDVYQGQHLYKIGAAASMSILAILIFVPGLIYTVWAGNTLAIQIGNIVIGFVLAGLTAYVLDTLRRLLVWRFGMQALNRAFKTAIAAYLLWLAADIVSLAIYNAPLYIGTLRALSEAVTGFDKGLIVVAWAGQIGLGLSGLLISWALWQAQDDLYGIGKILSVCLAVMAVPIGLSGFVVNLGWGTAVEILYLLVVMGHIFVWPVITMLFIRAIFRPPAMRPPQLA